MIQERLFFIMKINNFRGELTDIWAKTEALLAAWEPEERILYSSIYTSVCFFKQGILKHFGCLNKPTGLETSFYR